MTVKKLIEVPEDLNEEFYQINLDIRNSFHKYRPPVDLFRFHEEVSRIEPYYTVGGRLSNEQVAEYERLVQEGFAFVSRKDHSVYVKHIAHQLDLVLVDKNLRPSEIADIFIQALTMRMEQFLDQPVRVVYDRLHEDIMVLTEYLAQDIFRIKGLCRRLHLRHTLARHSVNCGIFGLALFLIGQADDFANQQELNRKALDNFAVGLFLHDMGMTKVPAFIRDKTKTLTPDEQQKVLQHVKAGYEMLMKLELRFGELEKCVLEHHERVNGSGYPSKARDHDISYFGRLCGYVDSFCSMITERPYAKAMTVAEAAQALGSDERRYDKKISALLISLLATKKLHIEVQEIEAAPVPTADDDDQAVANG